MEKLWDLPLFENLTDDELDWLRENSTVVTLETGDYFYREDEPVDSFYVVLEGEMQITRTLNGHETVMGTTPRGVIGGEMALLNMTASQVSACAIAPTRLLVLGVKAFRQVFSACPPFGMYILRTAAERMSGTANIVTQQEKLAALGKFSAGLAHELNNPASAAKRASQSLKEMLPSLVQQTLELCSVGLPQELLLNLIHVEHDVIRTTAEIPVINPLEQSDREEELMVWLEGHNVENSWEVGPTLVSANITIADLEAMTAGVPENAMSATLGWLCTTLTAARLLDDVDQSSGRISDLVKAIKEYTFMDQGEVQAVDLHKGLENTLRVLSHKLKNIEIIREYDSHLPKIEARGGELNQVWTNLIDNAVSAMQGKGILKVTTRAENNFAMVEIADNGPGITPDILPRIFEPFYTTKGVGEGTGLGLDIAYRVVKGHKGTIEVQSEPGNTRFIVRLPVG